MFHYRNTALACAVILMFIFRITYIQAQVSHETGLDVAIIIDDALDGRALSNAEESSTAMYKAVNTVATLLSERTTQQAPTEHHSLVVVRTANETSTIALAATSLPLPDDSRLPTGQRCSGSCYTNFIDALQTAINASNDLNTGDNRQQLILIFTDEPAGDNDANSASFADLSNHLRELATTAANRAPNAEIHFIGFREEARWQAFDRELTDVFDSVDGGAWVATTPDAVDSYLVSLLRSKLAPIGSVIASGSFDVEPFTQSITLHHYRNPQGSTIQLAYKGVLPDDTTQITQTDGRYIQTIRLENPTPGRWELESSVISDPEIEFLSELATFRQAVTYNRNPVDTIPVNQLVQLEWVAIGANGEPVDYNEATYTPTVTLKATNGVYSYEVPLAESNGIHHGELYFAQPGNYRLSPLVHMSGKELVGTDPISITVTPIEVVVNTPPNALQFNDWQFTMGLSGIGQNTLLTNLPRPPIVEAELVLPDGLRFPLSVTHYDPQSGLFTSDSIDLPFNTDFAVDVQATMQDANGELVTLTPRTSEGRVPVELTIDRGQIAFETTTTRLFDSVQIFYSPTAITAQTLAEHYSPNVQAIVYENVESDKSTPYILPMELQLDDQGNTVYGVTFSPTRDVVHSVQVKVEGIGVGNTRQLLVGLEGNNRLDPSPITVTLEAAEPQPFQFVPWSFDLLVLDDSQPLATPFTSGIEVNLKVQLLQDGKVVANIPLEQVDISRFSGEYTFLRTGNYTFDVHVNIPHGAAFASIKTEDVSLAFEDFNANRQIAPTSLDFTILNGEDRVDASPALETLLFSFRPTQVDLSTYKPNAELRLTLTESEASPWLVPMDYDHTTNTFTCTFTPVLAGTYQAEVQVYPSADYGTAPIFSINDVGVRQLVVRPVSLDVTPLTTTRIRQTDPIHLQFILRDGEQIYDGTRMRTPPRARVAVYKEGRDTAVVSADANFDPTLNGYSIILPPLAETGDYRIEVSAQSQDSTGRDDLLPLSADAQNLSVVVEETLNIIVQMQAEEQQYSSGILPFTRQHPMRIEVGLDSLPVSLFEQETDSARRQTLEPLQALGTEPDNWFMVEVRDGDLPIDSTSYSLSAPTLIGNHVAYEITGLPTGRIYEVRVALQPGIQPLHPYAITSSTANYTMRVTYEVNPLLGVTTSMAGLLIASAVITSTLHVRARNRRYAPSGYLYLTDSYQRVFWVKDLNTLKRNVELLTGVQGWERARIGRLEITNNAKLQQLNQLQFKLYIGTANPITFVLTQDDEPIGIGNQAFHLGLSSKPVKRHTSELELERIKLNDRNRTAHPS